MEIIIKKTTIRKVGNSHCITIPSPYIKNGLIQKEKRYDLTLKLATT